MARYPFCFYHKGHEEHEGEYLTRIIIHSEPPSSPSREGSAYRGWFRSDQNIWNLDEKKQIGLPWSQSDVNAGRVIGAAVVARLHTDPVFLAQLAVARKELAAVWAKGIKPSSDCKAEAAALAFQ